MERHRFLSGICPDEHCHTKLYFPSYETGGIECSACGQRHLRQALRSVAEVTDPDVVLHNMARNLLVGNFAPKKTTDSVKVHGLSNYHCKLLSPLLTNHGMDKQGKAQPLRDLTQSSVFDCGNLGGRAFLLQPEHIDTMGFGRDRTGSTIYLRKTLEEIKKVNGDTEVLIPIHADGDGHCLVHGISRALVGRELFWHALRTNLKQHFEANLDQYKDLFRDYYDSDAWAQIIAESDPDYVPGPNEAMGLQNIHIFGLANVLRRPIVLLDEPSGLTSLSEYSAVFLPILSTPEACRGKDGHLNKPLCVAWSSSGRNHFIALVGVRGRPLPRLPGWMLAKAWGPPPQPLNSYIEFDAEGMCTVGGDRTLTENYVKRLATAMEDLFHNKHGVHPSLVSDVYNFIYQRTGVVGVHQNVIIEHTRASVQDHQLFRCLTCSTVSQVPYPQGYTGAPSGLKSGGELYKIAEQVHGALQEGRVYSFPAQGIQCSYDVASDELIPDHTFNQDVKCPFCQGSQLRRVKADGSVVYLNGDRTSSPSSSTTCNCGHKHFWDGVEYDNPPKMFKVPLVWKGKTIEEDVVWFQNETNPSLNSNAFKIAESLVNKHYPGEFGNEQLAQKVVESILQNTASMESAFQPPSLSDIPGPSSSINQTASTSKSLSGGATPMSRPGRADGKDTVQSGRESPRKGPGAKSKEGSPARSSNLDKHQASKIIISGGSKSLHKEELTLSETERALRQRISENAPHNQQQKTAEERSLKPQANISLPSTSSSTTSPSLGSGEMKIVAMDTGSSSRTIEPPRDIRIKLSSPEGKHTTLVLDGSTTYSQLQTLIESKFHVAPARQKIKYGFPPKELRAPPAGEEGTALPLRNGDKVTVEIIQDTSRADAHHVSAGIAANRQRRIGDCGLDQGNLLKEFQRDIDKIKESQEGNLEVQLTSHTFMAALSGLDLWNYSKKKPELFSRGGLFYNIVERDLGLEDGKHCMLPSIPEKRFRFSQPNDRLELCLEPLGHFPISPDVDDLEKFKDIALGQRSLEMSEGHHQGENEPSSSGYVPFSGRGHSLGTSGGTKALNKDEDGDNVMKLKKYQKMEHDSSKEGETSCSNVGRGAIPSSEIEDKVQYRDSHIPSEMKHPRRDMEEAMRMQGLCEDVEHSKVTSGIQRGVSDCIDGGTVDVGHTTDQDRGDGLEEDTAMDIDEQEGKVNEHPSDKGNPLPMDVDSAEEKTIPAPPFAFSQSQAGPNVGITADLRRFNTEPAIGQTRQDTAMSRVASDPNLLLPKSNTSSTSQATPSHSSQGPANEIFPTSSLSQPAGNTNPSDGANGQENKNTSESTNQETDYVSRKLGPGFTVLVKRDAEKK